MPDLTFDDKVILTKFAVSQVDKHFFKSWTLENPTSDNFNNDNSPFEYSITTQIIITTNEIADICTNTQEKYEDNDDLAQ